MSTDTGPKAKLRNRRSTAGSRAGAGTETADGPLIGLLQTQPSLLVTELAGFCGYDFVFLDGEHGTFCDASIVEALQYLGAANLLSIVRTRGSDPRDIGRFMDFGASIILVPDVRSADQARALAAGMKYPPSGTRGFGASLHRSTKYGATLAAHMDGDSDASVLMVIIESEAGVLQVEAILDVDGVGGAFIGPMDLSNSVGAFDTPAYGVAVARIERAARERGKLIGTAPHPGSDVDALLRRDYDLIVLGSEVSTFRAALEDQVERFRARVREYQGGKSNGGV